jgi:hypothetical protein
MHPEHPCAHCITSSAVGAVLTQGTRGSRAGVLADQHDLAGCYGGSGQASRTTTPKLQQPGSMPASITVSRRSSDVRWDARSANWWRPLNCVVRWHQRSLRADSRDGPRGASPARASHMTSASGTSRSEAKAMNQCRLLIRSDHEW